MAPRGGSYESVTLRPSNIKYVSDRTGLSIDDLRAMLARARKEGKYEVRVPIGIKVFRRRND